MSNLLYGSSYGMGSLIAGGAIWTIGFVVFIIASIVMGYMFLSKNASQRNTRLGKLLTFDQFVIKKVIQVINLVCVVGITVVSLCIILTFATAGFLSFLMGLVFGAVFFCVSQLINRLIFEQVMLMVSITTDVKDLRNRFVDGGKAEVAPATTSETPATEPAPKPAVSAGTAQAAPTAAGSWNCSCGSIGNTGRFCAKCGSPRA